MKNRKKASSIVYIIFFFGFFLVLCAFAIDGTITFTNREKLQNATEMAAMAAASAFETDTDIAAAKKAAQDTYQILEAGGSAKVPSGNLNDDDFFKVETIPKAGDTSSGIRKVRVSVKAISQPFFLTFLGVSGIPLKADACAVRENMPIKSTYGGKIIGMSSRAGYGSDIVTTNFPDDPKNNYNDTAILTPLGDAISKAKSTNYSSSATTPDYSSIDSAAGAALSLGAGGFITIRLPAPMTNKPGNDLFIGEAGDAKEGYMVFAGLDNEPTDPYIDNEQHGLSGISWVNISCTGRKADNSSAVMAAPHDAATGFKLTGNKKVYGSAYFDIGNSCFGKISMAKYIRIIDDNAEDAYYSNVYTPIYGEASTSTPGADIDEIKLLNHVKLISPKDF